MEEFKLDESDLNETEARLIYLQFGVRFPRSLSHVDMENHFNQGRNIETTQSIQREDTQKFVTKNWEFLKNVAEAYGCTGNCASPFNLCTDARASNCYQDCFPQKRKRRR